MRRSFVLAATVTALAGICVALPAEAGTPAEPATAATPPMGWNSWNSFGCEIDENKIKSMADALVASGMRDAGYQYVVIDDCWFDPNRTADGSLRGDPKRFPSGMKAVGDYVHGKGLKFGLYQVPTEKTCAQRNNAYPGETGSGGHEHADARTFASWGVDYLKYDWCSPAGTLDDQIRGFTTMRDALAATGRPIVYSINANSYHFPKNGQVHDWNGIAHLSRTTEDIKPVWKTGNPNEYPMGVTDIIDINNALTERAKPGYYNDPDMLEVGVYDVEGYPGLTDTEARAHFGMWALMSAPLIAGNDVRAMKPEISRILNNRDVIAVNQDSLARQADLVDSQGTAQVYRKPMADGSIVVGLLNRTETARDLTATTAQLGLDEYTARDLHTGEVTGRSGDLKAAVPAHGLQLFRLYGS
ncbi:glycoside hydrolase family 27 protein [Amycolatopsis nigrescens]|uniref:glycoside hydrolase family 27 protein n=1 Tax=Amycolatopsis nigrescens TaxID=381445 RepID=UPI000363EA1B|nr:glycoside hydrolase family 27 protein [Amycolatopsis nigrescens]